MPLCTPSGYAIDFKSSSDFFRLEEIYFRFENNFNDATKKFSIFQRITFFRKVFENLLYTLPAATCNIFIPKIFVFTVAVLLRKMLCRILLQSQQSGLRHRERNKVKGAV